MWNLDNLDANVQHGIEIFKRPIKSVDVCIKSERIFCHDNEHREIKIVDLSSGKTLDTIEQGKDVQRATHVFQFCNGKFAITRNIKSDDDDDDEDKPLKYIKEVDWDILREDIIWDLSTKKKLCTVPQSRFVVFDYKRSEVAGFVQCEFHSNFDWTTNLYNFIAWYPNSAFYTNQKQESMNYHHYFTFPKSSEFVCPPIIHVNSQPGLSEAKKTVFAVLQICYKTMGLGGVEKSRSYENVLFIKTLEKDGRSEEKTKSMSDLLKHPEEGDRLAYLQIVKNNNVLIIYVKGVNHFSFDNRYGLVIPPGLDKGSILYDPIKDVVLCHNPRILHRDTDLNMCLMSKSSSIRLDNNMRVFHSVTNQMIQVNADVYRESMCLALDGRYLVGLCDKRRSVVVYRTSDGQNMGSLYIHGEGTCLQVAADDRTIIVGCHDGRVLILSLILELSDPYSELIKKLKSRSVVDNFDPDQILQLDIQDAVISHSEMIRQASRIKNDMKSMGRRQISFKTLSQAVALTKSKSSTCCVQ